MRGFLWTPGGTDGVPGNPQMKDLGALGGPTRGRIAQEHQQGPVDLVVEVDRTASFERLAVERPGFGEAVDVAVVAALRLVGIDETEANHGERFDPRSDRVAVAAPREIDEVADDASHIGLVDGAPLLRLRRERRRAVDDRHSSRRARARLARVAHVAQPSSQLGKEMDEHHRQFAGYLTHATHHD